MASAHVFNATQLNFEQEVIAASHQQPILVDFWAAWCGPCRQLMPMLEQIVNEAGGTVKLAKVDTDQETALAGAFGIRSLPTVVLFKDGQIVDGFMGVQPVSGIKQMLAKHLGEVAEPEPEVLDEPMLDPSERIETLKAEIAQSPEKEELVVELAELYARMGQVTEAEAALGNLKTLVEGDGAKRVRALLSFHHIVATAPEPTALEQRIAKDGSDLEARHQLGVFFLLAGQDEAALDQFLVMMKLDRSYGDDLGRKTLIDAFRVIADDDLVGSYRRKMSSLVF